MAEMRKENPGGAVCDDKCGCPSPCPGGATCRCKGVGPTGGGGEEEHMTCRCGEHCGCNPCSCPKASLTAAACKCGPACSCSTCAAAAASS